MINEEISTIFVVGFPDDMQEREFQNMFIFSPGFEAATLKIPQKDSPTDNENDDAVTNGLSNGRKQIIGFAKFRTRMEAIDARDILSGRKVDAEKGSVLKAEMAKKNLHTKRGLSNDQNPLITPNKRFPPTSINTTAANYEAYQFGGPQLPSDLLSPQDYVCDYGCDFYSDVSVYTPTTPTTPVSVFPDQSPYATSRSSFDATNGTAAIGGLVGAPRGLVNGTRYTHKGFLDDDDLNYFPKTNPVEITKSAKVPTNGFSSALLVNDEFTSRMAQLNMSIPSTVSPSPSIPSNPADQNPPCNTLYVGNLPMDTNEEELKELFSKCPGYKRMCFRTKQNGPMCFVEFEDVQYATRAMAELHGNRLSNSVRGGIRLSFSKNPLGVRSNNNHERHEFGLERRGSDYSLLSDRSNSNFSMERRDSNFGLDRRDSVYGYLGTERRDSSYGLERRDSGVLSNGSFNGSNGSSYTFPDLERRGSGSSFFSERRDYFDRSFDRRESSLFDPQLA